MWTDTASGDSGIKEYEARTGRQKKKKEVSSATNQGDFAGHVRVYFPSRDTVRQSLGGADVSAIPLPTRAAARVHSYGIV